MIRAILDTNTLVSANVFGGVPGHVFDQAGVTYRLVISRAGLDELDDVLARPKIAMRARLGAADRQALGQRVERLAEVVEVLEPVPTFEPDPRDTHLLACAVTGHADCLVTGDHELLALRSYQGTTILTARAFLDLLESIQPS